MSRLLFTKVHVVKQGDGKGPVYKPGDVVDFDGVVAETYAAKYKRIGVAVDAPLVSGDIESHFDTPALCEQVKANEEAFQTGLTEAVEEMLSQPKKRRGRPPKNA